jgi:hypothetical protein
MQYFFVKEAPFEPYEKRLKKARAGVNIEKQQQMKRPEGRERG